MQQIDLYRDRRQQKRTGRAGRLPLFAGIAALGLVGVLAASGEVYLSRLSAERSKVMSDLDRQRAALAGFRETLAAPQIDPHLEAELQRLQASQQRVNASLVALSQQGAAARPAFAEVFIGLARNTVEGLWLNDVGLSGGGAELWLKGRTIEPALVPRLLQRLAVEPAFAGRTFRKVRFERQASKPTDIVDFELRSAGAGRDDDAG